MVTVPVSLELRISRGKQLRGTLDRCRLRCFDSRSQSLLRSDEDPLGFV